jgi:hypothetical protein
MLRNPSLILCLALVVLGVACANAPAPPPPDTRAADVQAVKDLEASWVKDANSKDADSGPTTLRKMVPASTPVPGH